MYPSYIDGAPHLSSVFVGDIKRGDVIVFEHTLQEKTLVIKRVIGVAGDQLTFRLKDGKLMSVNNHRVTTLFPKNKKPIAVKYHSLDASGRVYEFPAIEKIESIGLTTNIFEIRLDALEQNDQKTQSKLLSFDFLRTLPNNDGYVTVTVPHGKLFTLSDNRGIGVDSRFFGFVDEENIVSKSLKTI
jgi:signal peptidase I